MSYTEQISRRSGNACPPPEKRVLKSGTAAERWVEEQLIRAGWQVLARNYRRRGFELDLLVRDQRSLVVVEVKYRCQPADTQIHELLPPRKLRSLRRGIRYYLGEMAVAGKLTGYEEKLLAAFPESIRLDLALVHGTAPEYSCRYIVDAEPL